MRFIFRVPRVRRLSWIVGPNAILVALLLAVPTVDGTATLQNFSPAYRNGSTVVGTWSSVTTPCGATGTVSTPASANLTTGSIRMSMNVSAGQCGHGAVIGMAGFLLPFNVSNTVARPHKVSVRWSLDWLANATGQSTSCGFNTYRAIGHVDAAVYMSVIDLSTGASLSSTRSPVHLVKFGTSGSPVSSTGPRNVTLNLTGSMIAYHAYVIDTFLLINVHATGSTCNGVTVSSTARFDLASAPYGGTLMGASVR